MKNTILNKTRLVALTLAAATLVTPFYASAQDFSNRRGNSDAGAQIAGGLIGGSLGAIVGEGIAGRGNRTEGAVIGAIIGGVTGAAIGEGIADNGNNGRRSARSFNNNRSFRSNGFNNRGLTNVSVTTRVAHNNSGFNSHGFRNDPGYGKRTSASIYHKIDKLDYRVDVLKYEQKEIYAELKYRGHNPYLKERLYYIDCEIAELKDRRRFLTRNLKRNRIHNSRSY